MNNPSNLKLLITHVMVQQIGSILSSKIQTSCGITHLWKLSHSWRNFWGWVVPRVMALSECIRTFLHDPLERASDPCGFPLVIYEEIGLDMWMCMNHGTDAKDRI